MALINGQTYRLQSRADKNRSLNVFGNSPQSLANICLYTSNDDDICQQWVYKKVGSRQYLLCKGDQNLALDLFTGSSSTANVKDYNAHVYAPSKTSYIEIEEVSGGYIRIKLDHNGRYLTANQGKNGTSTGKDVNAPGNVYFYNGGLTDNSQDWLPCPLRDGTTDPGQKPELGKEVVVTGMPSCWAYTGNTEYFHPGSGMVNGTWSKNGGAAKERAIKAFYKEVFDQTSAPNDKCLYNLFGARYAVPAYKGKYHSGIDMNVAYGAEIHSAHAGEVTGVGGNYGIVAIYDEEKDVTYLYLHMDVTNTDARVGGFIKKGDLLGTQAYAGLKKKEDTHLHIEVRAGRQDNPAGLPTINQALTSISPYNYL